MRSRAVALGGLDSVSRIPNLALFGLPEVRSLAAQTIPWLIPGLWRTGGVNLLVGDKGLGKTPLLLQLALSLSSGDPFLHLPCRQGKVLYCVGEGDPGTYVEMADRMRGALGIDPEPSRENLLMWAPNWGSPSIDGRGLITQLRDLLQHHQPSFIIIDTLRTFAPEAESENSKAAELIRSLRVVGGSSVTWLLSHHVRKDNRAEKPTDYQAPSLVEEPELWFQATSGASALITNADTRLGLDRLKDDPRGDLLMAGFVRTYGKVGPFYLERLLDNFGDPLAYVTKRGTALLTDKEQILFQRLPLTFTFADTESLFSGHGKSRASRFLSHLQSAGLVERLSERPARFRKRQ